MRNKVKTLIPAFVIASGLLLTNVHAHEDNKLEPIKSLTQIQDLPVSQYNKGVVSSLVAQSLSRFANHQSMLNFISGKPVSIKAVLDPHSMDQDGLILNLYLFPEKEGIITDQEILSLVDRMSTEVQATLAYFDKSMSSALFKGRIEERLANGKLVRAFDLAKVITQLNEGKAVEAIGSRIIALANLSNSMRNGSTQYDEQKAKEVVQAFKQIVSRIGWPIASKFGANTAQAGWLIAHQAEFDRAFQKEVLKLFKSLEPGLVEPAQIAFLEDRILILDGKLQKYGTQYEIDEKGNIIPRAIEDFESIDERRKSLGLQPFNDYLSSLKESYARQKKATEAQRQAGTNK